MPQRCGTWYGIVKLWFEVCDMSAVGGYGSPGPGVSRGLNTYRSSPTGVLGGSSVLGDCELVPKFGRSLVVNVQCFLN